MTALGYIEGITYATNDIEKTENECVKDANNHFNNFPASVYRCTFIISAEITA